jgi:hypothetical protein
MKKKSEEVFFNGETYFGEQKNKKFSRMQECTPSLLFDTFQFLIKKHQIQRKTEIQKENEENELLWISNATTRKRSIICDAKVFTQMSNCLTDV